MQPNISSGHLSWNRSRKGYKKGTKILLRVIGMFIILLVVVASQGMQVSKLIYFLVQFKYVQFSLSQLHLNKVVENKF